MSTSNGTFSSSSSSSTSSQYNSTLELSDLQTPMSAHQPQCLGDALNVINELKDYVARTYTDLQAQAACTEAEREGRLRAERKLETETIKLNRTAQTLVLAEGTIRSHQETQRRLHLRQQDLCKAVEKQISMLLGKMQLEESNDSEGKLTFSVNMEEAAQLEELLMMVREKTQNNSNNNNTTNNTNDNNNNSNNSNNSNSNNTTEKFKKRRELSQSEE